MGYPGVVLSVCGEGRVSREIQRDKANQQTECYDRLECLAASRACGQELRPRGWFHQIGLGVGNGVIQCVLFVNPI